MEHGEEGASGSGQATGTGARGSRVARAAAFARGRIARFARDNWESAILDVEQLEPQLRWLSIVGYGSALLFLLFNLGAELIGPRLPQVVFTMRSGEGIPASVPWVVMAGASVAYVLGWALLLTGASDCRRRVFVPVLLLFLMSILITLPDESISRGRGVFLTFALTCTGVVLMSVVYLVTYRAPIWRRYPLAEFGGWLLVLATFMGLLWLYGQGAAEVATDLDTVMDGLMLVAIPFWVWLGIDAADAVLESAGGVVSTLNVALSGRRLVAATIPIQITLLVMSGVLLTRMDAFVAFFCFSPLLIGISAILLLARQGQRRNSALLVLWGTLAAFLLTLFVGLAMEGSDVNEVVLSATGLFPPAFLFSFLLLYDVATFGKRFASVDGAVLPRSGRILMYLGVVLLFGAFSLFKLNVHVAGSGEPYQAVQELVNGLIFLSMVFLAPVAMLWLFLRRRHQFLAEIGAIDSRPPAIAGALVGE